MKICFVIRNALLFFFVLFCSSVTGQDEKSTVSGKVTDSKTGKIISSVNIRVYGTERGTTTDSQGKFSVWLSNEDSILIFSHTGYSSEVVTITVRKNIQGMEVKLEQSMTQLPPVDITGGAEKLDTPGEQYIFDYELWNDKILLITHTGNMNRARLVMTDDTGNEISSHPIPESPNELFSDCMGRIYILSSQYAYLISADTAFNLSLIAYPMDEFNSVARTCAAQYRNYFFFGDYGTGKLSVEYSYVNSSVKTKTIFKEISDSKLQAMYRNEPGKYFDTNGELKKKLDHGARYDEDFELHFMRTQVYKPVYTPLKRIGDSLYLFNHYEDVIEIFSGTGQTVRKYAVTYHKENKWGKQIITDDSSKKAYTVYLKDGICHLREINLSNGTLGASFKMEYTFVEKIKIVSGVLYFLYRPDLESRRKYLYRQRVF